MIFTAFTLAAADDAFPWLTVGLRWVHIVSACLAIGGPFFMRYIVVPAARKGLGDEQAEELRLRIMARWKFFVHLLIAAFIVTGLYAFWVNMPRKENNWESLHKMLYHAIFGIKMILALAMFFIASALVGRSPAMEKFRQHHKRWTTVAILLGLLIVAAGGILRQLHTIYENRKPAAVATQPS